MIKCLICNREFKNRTSLTNHLRFKHQLLSKEYYNLYLKKEQDGKCQICGKPVDFVNIEYGYKVGCCMEHTNIAKYGKDYAKRSKETRKKISDTVKSEECQNKTIETNLKRYGVERYTNPEKSKQTNLERYGHENPFGSQIIQEKIKQTKIEKYGDINYNNYEKIKQTKLEKYGDEYYLNLEKRKKTCLKRFGVEHAFQSKKIREKINKTNLKKYGSISPFGNEEIIKKSKQTCKEKYNDANYNNREQAIRTRKSNVKQFELNNDCTLISKLVKKYGQGWLILKNDLDILKNGYNVFVKNYEINKIKEYTNASTAHTSRLEKEIVDYIKNIYSGIIIENDRQIIKPLELDIYIPEKNLAIEFNGTFWHSSLYTPKNYHFNKSIACQNKGIRLIHIYEYEWLYIQDKIKQLVNIALGNASTIGARLCTIREISNQEAKVLNEQIHLQGHRNAQITYGLFYENKLVQLMSFSKTKYNRNLKNNNEYEIIRGCPGSNNIVIGGVSKLLKHFIREHKPTKIFSYCDFNKFNGKSYEKVGMKFDGYTGPDKTWIINGQPVKRNPSKYHEYKKQADAIMWGSGSKKYVLELE